MPLEFSQWGQKLPPKKYVHVLPWFQCVCDFGSSKAATFITIRNSDRAEKTSKLQTIPGALEIAVDYVPLEHPSTSANINLILISGAPCHKSVFVWCRAVRRNKDAAMFSCHAWCASNNLINNYDPCETLGEAHTGTVMPKYGTLWDVMWERATFRNVTFKTCCMKHYMIVPSPRPGDCNSLSSSSCCVQTAWRPPVCRWSPSRSWANTSPPWRWRSSSRTPPSSRSRTASTGTTSTSIPNTSNTTARRASPR